MIQKSCTLLAAAGLVLLETGMSLAFESVDSASLTDRAYLTASYWNDGKAEVAFYQVERDFDHHGEPNPQKFLMGTYLVKHDFDRARQSKAREDAVSPVAAFKWAAFYEFESKDDSDSYKLAYVVNAAQADLAPLKASFTSFDWCSNQYREMAFRPDGKTDSLMRSDDYGNTEASFDTPEGVYPVVLIPLLVRALDFASTKVKSFSILLEDGSTIPVTARLEGRETVETAVGVREAERIQLDYESEVKSIVSRRGERTETYWRSVAFDRALLSIQSPSYRVKLVELVRSPYWNEDLFPKLKHVKSRP